MITLIPSLCFSNESYLIPMKHSLPIAITILSIFASLGAAQPIEIAGTVIHPDSSAVEGASVKLTVADIATVTDSTGKFRVVVASTDFKKAPNFKEVPTTFNGKFVSFCIPKEGTSVSIEIFDISGKRIAIPVNNTFTTGNYVFNPFTISNFLLSSQFYLLRVRIGNKVNVFKVMGVDNRRAAKDRNRGAAGTPALMKTMADEVHDTLVISKQGYFDLQIIIDNYTKDLGPLVLIKMPLIPDTKNIGNEQVIILPQSNTSIEGSVKISSFTGNLIKPWKNDSVICSPIVISAREVLHDTSGFVIRIPLTLNRLKNPDALTVFAILQKDSLSIQYHGYLSGDTLTIHLPSIDSGMVISAGYNPNMVSIDVNYDSLFNRPGLNKKVTTTTHWPRYKWWCAFDQLDGSLRQYVADYYKKGSIADVTASDINIFLIDRLIIPSIDISYTYERMGFRAPEFDSIYNPPHSHINGDYLKGSYLGYYYLFFLIPEINAYAYGETNRFINNSWEPKGIFISPYWLTKVEPAVELGSGKGIFAHEMMHGIIYGYDLDYIFNNSPIESVNSYCASRIFHEAIATVCGHTLDYNLSGTNGIFVRPSPMTLKLPTKTITSNNAYLLDFPLLQDTTYRYHYHDFFAYFAIKYKNNKLDYLSDLLQTISSKLTWSAAPGWTMDQYILHNLKSTNTYFNDSLWFYYSDFIRNRAYEHNEACSLRIADPVDKRYLRNDLFKLSVPSVLSNINSKPLTCNINSFQSVFLKLNTTTIPKDTPLGLMITSKSVPIQPESLQVVFYPENSDGTGNLNGTVISNDFRWSKAGANEDTMVVNLSPIRNAEGQAYGTLLIMNCAFRTAEEVTCQLITAPDFEVTMTLSANGVIPLVVTFVPKCKPNSSPVRSWTWNFDDGATSRLEKPSHIYSKRGLYSFTVIGEGPVGIRTTTYPDAITATPYTIVNTLTSRKSLECTGTSCNASIDANRSNCFVLDYGASFDNVDGTFEFKLAGEDVSCAGPCSLFISEDKSTWLPLWGTRTGATANSTTTYEGDIYNEDRSFRYIAAYAPNCGMELFDYTIHKKPSAYFVESTSIPKIGDKVVFNGESCLTINNGDPASTAIKSYLWDFGDGHIATGQIVEHVFATAGTFPVTLFITDQQNGNDFMVKTVAVTE